jgi:hypothetical protein
MADYLVIEDVIKTAEGSLCARPHSLSSWVIMYLLITAYLSSQEAAMGRFADRILNARTVGRAGPIFRVLDEGDKILPESRFQTDGWRQRISVPFNTIVMGETGNSFAERSDRRWR